MSAMTTIAPLALRDEFAVFLPDCAGEELELRRKLRSMRNCAAAMIANTECDTARQLGWICQDYATELVYAPATPELLEEAGRLCQRLMLSAMQAERLHHGIGVGQ